VHVEVDEESFRRTSETLARLLVDHPTTRKHIKKLLAKEANKIRRNITRDVHTNMANDPRKAYHAVKRSLYKQVLGFNVSILDSTSAVKSMTLYRKPRLLDANPNQRGGNRRPRGFNTKRIDGYFGKDRAFILRFYNSGTGNRDTRYGNRGAMRSRRVFETSATFQMQGAMETISTLIEEVMAEEFNNA
jgi:hypothetical protein